VLLNRGFADFNQADRKNLQVTWFLMLAGILSTKYADDPQTALRGKSDTSPLVGPQPTATHMMLWLFNSFHAKQTQTHIRYPTRFPTRDAVQWNGVSHRSVITVFGKIRRRIAEEWRKLHEQYGSLDYTNLLAQGTCNSHQHVAARQRLRCCSLTTMLQSDRVFLTRLIQTSDYLHLERMVAGFLMDRWRVSHSSNKSHTSRPQQS
jgi:hypothetical protein